MEGSTPKVREALQGAGSDTFRWATGSRAKGEFRCEGCGYGVTVYRELPECPMCKGTSWERVPWRPYSRSFRVRT